MGRGFFIDDIKNVKHIDEDNNIGSLIKHNIISLKNFIIKNSKKYSLFVFKEDSPFFDFHNEQGSCLGLYDKELLDLGNTIKKYNVRLCTVFQNPELGFANDDYQVLKKVDSYLKAHSEFYDLCRLDYSHLIFIPYGNTYLCDYHKFKKVLSSYQKYISNRIGIIDVGNFESMVIASHQKLPWIYDTRKDDAQDAFLFKSIESFLNFRLSTNSRPIIISEDERSIKDYDVLCFPVKKIKLKKVKVKNAKSSKLSTAAITKNRKEKTSRA